MIKQQAAHGRIFAFLVCCFLMLEGSVDAFPVKKSVEIIGLQAQIIIKDVVVLRNGRRLIEGVLRLPDFDQNVDKFMKKKGDLLRKKWRIDVYWLGETDTQIRGRRVEGKTKMDIKVWIKPIFKILLFRNKNFVSYSLGPPVFRTMDDGRKRFFLTADLKDIKGVPRFIERLSGALEKRDITRFYLPDFEYGAGEFNKFKWCALTKPKYNFTYTKEGEDLLMNFKINAKLSEKECDKK